VVALDAPDLGAWQRCGAVGVRVALVRHESWRQPVTGGNAPLGRRDNGLHTTDYAALADVDPRVGEHLLKVLGERGIAAYLKPTSDVDPFTRTASLPSPPTDRLYVDRAALPTARALLDEALAGAEEPEPEAAVTAVEDGAGATTASGTNVDNVDDFEAAWALIVAGYDATATPERNWPLDDGTSAPTAPMATAEPVDTPPEPPEPPTSRRVIKPAKPYLNDDGGSLLDGLDGFGAGLSDDDDEEDFKPPAPPPLPRMTAAAITGVLAVVLGMVAIFFPDLIAVLTTTETQVLGGLMVLGGTALLISRLRPGRDDEDSDPDDGARV
jgi:hypothetical protein